MRRAATGFAIAVALTLTEQAGAAFRTGVGLGVFDFGSGDPAAAFVRARAAGTNVVRLSLSWATVAKRRPAAPRDPSDPAYNWAVFDWQVRGAVAAGLDPLVIIEDIPKWAQDLTTPLPWRPATPALFSGAARPDPAAFGDFARAAARHYGGGVPGIPRVRMWLATNEPNLSVLLLPQFEGNRAVSVARYRSMLNAFAAGIHAAHADNVVVAGGLAPFGARTRLVQVVAPLRFLRELVCMSGGARPRPTCAQRASFDAWGVQPYTSGGPTHHAANPDDVSLGDLPEVARLLKAAARAKHVVARVPPRLWVTEFSWDTRPPDTNPDVAGIRLQARWVSEAVYRAWRAGASLFTWWALRDTPDANGHQQSGLYFRGGASVERDAPKPALAAFRFPFVAYRSGAAATVWGRTPGGRAGRVAVEETAGAGWRRLATFATRAGGVFSGRVRLASSLPTRARAADHTAAYRSAVRRDGPLSYWTLDEARGSSARDLAGRRNGVLQGGWTSVAGALGSDRAVALDGRTGRVSLGPLASPRTVELWLKTQTATPAAAFSNRDGESRYAYVGLADTVHALAFDSGGLASRAWVTDGRWHHLVYTYDAVTGRLYVDGVLDAAGALPRAAGGAQAWLGYDATLKRRLRGSLDEVAVYGYALTAAQVRAHFLASGRTLGYRDRFEVMSAGRYLRARLSGTGDASLPFSLKRVPDRYVLPLGL